MAQTIASYLKTAIQRIKTWARRKFPRQFESLKRLKNRWSPAPKENLQDRFQKIFRDNEWRDSSSRSGTGSSLEQTAHIREQLPLVLSHHQVRSMLDLPCGDFHWMQHVPLQLETYVGGDIVPEIIEENQLRFAAQGRDFRVLNLVEDRLPAVDLVFCRDCLVHLSYERIWQAIRNLKRSGSRYLMTTSFVEQKRNTDILSGNWRPLNLQLAPFCFPEPTLTLNEHCTESDGQLRDKSLCVWDIEHLPDVAYERPLPTRLEEAVVCTSCLSPDHRKVGQQGPFSVRSCNTCGLLFVTPRPDPTYLATLYEEDYFSGNSQHGNPTGYLSQASGYRARGAFMVKKICELSGVTHGSWLDIGCGPGFLVEAAQNAGFRACGIDVSQAAARWGREHLNLELYACEAERLEEVVTPPFQVVSLFDCLFHVRDPRKIIHSAFEATAPGGCLFAGPFDLHPTGWIPPTALAPEHLAGLGIPEHLTFVNETSMRQLLERVGYTDLRFIPMPESPATAVGANWRWPISGLICSNWLTGSTDRLEPLINRGFHPQPT